MQARELLQADGVVLGEEQVAQLERHVAWAPRTECHRGGGFNGGSGGALGTARGGLLESGGRADPAGDKWGISFGYWERGWVSCSAVKDCPAGDDLVTVVERSEKKLGSCGKSLGPRA